MANEKKSFWNKPANDMTVGDSLKYTGIITLGSLVVMLPFALIPAGIERYQDWKMKKAEKEKEKK